MDKLEPAPAPVSDEAPPAAPPHSRKPRQCTADYRWTQPKVLAFLEALSQCGQVAEAARAVGMSRQAAYDLRARLASPRFDAAFEGARRKGVRARAAASRARLAAARSIWEGPGIAELVARYGGTPAAAQADTSPAQADIRDAHADTSQPQADAPTAQVYTRDAQADASAHKPTRISPGPCNTRSMSRLEEARARLRAAIEALPHDVPE